MPSIRELLQQRHEIDQQLAEHAWIENGNNPIAELAEHIVAGIMGGERAPNNTTGYDVVLPNGQKVEVKSRRLRRGQESNFNAMKPPLQFDKAMFVVFNMDYSIRQVSLVNVGDIEQVSTWSRQNNGWAAHTRKVREAYQGGVDWTLIAREFWDGQGGAR